MNHKLIIPFIILLLLGIAVTQSSVKAESITINLLEGSFDITHQQLAEMPKTTVYGELYCDGYLLTGADWSGVQLSYFLSYLNVSAEVNSIQFTASDAYVVTIPIQLAQSPEIIIAYQINGQPLPEKLRLVLPDYNGASWISQIVSISTSNNVFGFPAFISVGGGMTKSTVNDLNDKAASLTPTYLPTTPFSSPDPQPTTGSSTPSPSPLSINSTGIEPTPKQQSVDQQSIGLDQISIAVVIAVIIVCLATGTWAYNHKIKTKR